MNICEVKIRTRILEWHTLLKFTVINTTLTKLNISIHTKGDVNFAINLFNS